MAMVTVTGEGLPHVDGPFRFGRMASAPAAPTSAAPPADTATSHRPVRGSSRQEARRRSYSARGVEEVSGNADVMICRFGQLRNRDGLIRRVRGMNGSRAK